MAKPKKEFKARVRKVQKHLKALTDLAVHEEQREALDSIQRQTDFLQSTQDAYFEGDPRPLSSEGRDSAPASA